jgi:hypothetical protein
MSDELLKNEGEGEDNETEAHVVRSRVRAETDEGAEDVEAHTAVREANDDDDDSDDVEAHRVRA